MRGLPWYIVLLLSVAVWVFVIGTVALVRHFRPPAPEPEPAGDGEDGEPVPAGVVSPGVAAEFTTDVRPYANGVLAVGEDPGGHVSLRDDGTDEGDT